MYPTMPHIGIAQFILLAVGFAAVIAFLNSRQTVISARVRGTKGVSSAKANPSDQYVEKSRDVDDKDWPPLNSLIGTNCVNENSDNITADVQFMLDFAIIGHPKTATSSTMRWLAAHDEIAMYAHELHYMQLGKPAELVQELYKFPAGRYYKRGYKAPRDIENPSALRAFAKHFPRTRLMIGLRHPVLWFESFYNFKVRRGYDMPPAELLIGPEREGMHGLSTDGARFHLHLDNLGKTNRTVEEQKLLSWGEHEKHEIPKMENPVFLYELGQLRDENETRVNLYLADLKQFLGLQHDLKPDVQTNYSRVKSHTISICDAKYSLVRAELMNVAREASVWIRQYFMKSPDVHVSSREYFETLLKTWLVDPCTTD